MKTIKMPKIGQFRQTIRDITSKAQFVGLDEAGEAIYDHTVKLPTVRFTGTVKTHGTNASIVIGPDGEIYAQSKSNIITPQNDNAGFAQFVSVNEDNIRFLMRDLKVYLVSEHNVYSDSYITVYGEWVGKGIQKGVAVSEIDKKFLPFGVKVTPPEGSDEDSYWVESAHTLFSLPDSIYPVNTFGTYKIDIDFNEPELAVNKLSEYTLEVEQECPVGRYFGVRGTGEGIVWEGWYQGIHRFKVKGEKHSTTKVKKLVEVDPVKTASIKEFIEYACTRNRFEQALTETGAKEMKQLGDLIRWVQQDIIAEELDVLEKNGLTHKDVGGKIAKQVRDWFMEIK